MYDFNNLLLINALTAFYFGRKYLNLKKNKSEDKDFERLSDFMINADKDNNSTFYNHNLNNLFFQK